MLRGWVNRRRDLGGLIFIDLRDRYGLTQVVFNPEIAPQAHAAASDVRSEFVLEISGTVRERPEGTRNAKLATGDIEVEAQDIAVLNTSMTPPFEISQSADDRRVGPPASIATSTCAALACWATSSSATRMVRYMRDYLSEQGFLEIETPLLIKSTPEGARDFLVPSSGHPGNFYALPQSPQQMKQFLMVAGLDRYFQIARCFRDEAQRADRQPEFTQLDIEMAFVAAERHHEPHRDALRRSHGALLATRRSRNAPSLVSPTRMP